MEALSRRAMSGTRLAAFRAVDAFAIEVFQALQGSPRVGQEGFLSSELRRSVARGGGALVGATAAAPGGAVERRCLERASSELLEARYYVFLARRLGIFDSRTYRSLTGRHDAALREVERLRDGGGPRRT